MKQYIIDAFSDKIFSGNPAAICVLDKPINDDLMLNIAKENNLSETAFIIKENNKYNLRWFTPKAEIDLCGHATLASAFVIMTFYDKNINNVEFNTLSGILTVEKQNDIYVMDFPAYNLKQTVITKEMEEAIGVKPLEAYITRDLLLVIDNEEQVRNLSPDIEKIKKLDGLLLHVSAKGKEYDCISRSFAPKLNVFEDPVCGSGHCHIVPYWAQKLNRNRITAYQASKRGGELFCKMNGNRIKIGGKAVLFAKSELFINNEVNL